MSVHRLAKYQTDDPFTRVPNSAVNDERLDLKARGLLLLMLSKPDGWTFRERHLAKVAGVGRDQLRAAMQTLIEAGYVVRSKETFDGKPPVTVTRVYDVPQVTEVGLPEVGFPDRGETRPLSNEGVLVTNEVSLATPSESPKTSKRDELFEAVAEACNIDWHNLTGSGRGAINKAVKELKDIGVTPDQVGGRAAAYRKTYPDAPLTPSALAKHWAALTPVGTAKRSSRPACEYCDQPLDAHDQQVCDAFGRFYR
jgi:biotin operon repressor